MKSGFYCLAQVEGTFLFRILTTAREAHSLEKDGDVLHIRHIS
jgi:hypothetical protein